MNYALLPNEYVGRPSFFLAMEEYVAENVGGDCFFTWQTQPSVVFGRNQIAEREVDTAYCRQHGIGLCRRKSGGGCIYSDTGNVMLSVVTDATESVGMAFNRYINRLTLALRRLGIDARATGRNDILVGGRKVSGGAFYRRGNRFIIHSTLLYDTDMEQMQRSITPPADKLSGKGVESVRQRIGLLKEWYGGDTAQLRSALRAEMTDGTVRLSASDVEAIAQMEQPYLRREWTFGRNPQWTETRRVRREGIGEVEMLLTVRGDSEIKAVELRGDFLQDLSGLRTLLLGRRADEAERLAERYLSEIYTIT